MVLIASYTYLSYHEKRLKRSFKQKKSPDNKQIRRRAQHQHNINKQLDNFGYGCYKQYKRTNEK